ncbi:hypothetical protein RJ640_028062 [Escallonia rubra]|uniref:Gamma-butyrobetaine hydroxylase-like N-terminal domain-containing protein n=1 Tax=Escallonia rubra TaxID=112253 RepID=A0AA88UC22_9ASTE|nr:hypothetical protein RJ640_028062 [Escallonia rubra]
MYLIRSHFQLARAYLSSVFLFQVEVEFADGNLYHLAAEFLRIHSPAADSKIRSVRGEKQHKLSLVGILDNYHMSCGLAVLLINDMLIEYLASLKQVIYGRRHVGIMSAEPVGNYGVRLLFDDLHKTGIYTWDYFYHLGSNKFSLMRNYIKTLKKHGLSRDPPRRK